MRKWIGWISVGGFLAVAIGIFWGAATQGTPHAEVSEPDKKQATFARFNQLAPDFELKDLKGNLVRLSDYEGKIRIVDFWATWCPPCVAEVPHFNSLQTKYSDDVVILGISLDREGAKAVSPFATKNNVTYPLLLGDMKTVQAYGGIQSIPTTFVIDQEGRFYAHYVGYKPEITFENDILALRSQ